MNNEITNRILKRWLLASLVLLLCMFLLAPSAEARDWKAFEPVRVVNLSNEAVGFCDSAGGPYYSVSAGETKVISWRMGVLADTDDTALFQVQQVTDYMTAGAGFLMEYLDPPGEGFQIEMVLGPEGVWLLHGEGWKDVESTGVPLALVMQAFLAGFGLLVVPLVIIVCIRAIRRGIAVGGDL